MMKLFNNYDRSNSSIKVIESEYLIIVHYRLNVDEKYSFLHLDSYFGWMRFDYH